MRGYVKLRRGFLEHLKIMSFSELKVYIGLLLLANFKNGHVDITVADLCDRIGTSYKNTLNSIHRLNKFGYVKFTQAKNQWKNSHFEIMKFNITTDSIMGYEKTPTKCLCQKDISTIKMDKNAYVKKTRPMPEANVLSSSNDNGLQLPKKLEEVKIYKVRERMSGKPDLEAPIAYLNEKTGRNFSLKNESNRSLVRARFNEGRSLEDFKRVVDTKAAQWFTDEKMVLYLRPSTLFSRTNFENYLNEPEIKPKSLLDKYEVKGGK